MGKGHDLGLVSAEVYQRCVAKQNAVNKEIHRLDNTSVVPDQDTRPLLSKMGIDELKGPTTLSGLLRRPEIRYQQLLDVFNGTEVPEAVGELVEIEVKYAAFIHRQNQMVQKQKKLENFVVPADMDYEGIPGLSNEEVQKLERIRPTTLGQAARISGVNPSAITILMLWLDRRSHNRSGATQTPARPS